MQPVQLKVLKQGELFIKWDNNTESAISLKKMRRLCPCASCSAEREKESKNFIPLFMSDQLQVAEIKTIGNYAVGVTWKDGHNTGMYEYPYLLKLAEN